MSTFTGFSGVVISTLITNRSATLGWLVLGSGFSLPPCVRTETMRFSAVSSPSVWRSAASLALPPATCTLPASGVATSFQVPVSQIRSSSVSISTAVSRCCDCSRISARSYHSGSASMSSKRRLSWSSTASTSPHSIPLVAERRRSERLHPRRPSLRNEGRSQRRNQKQHINP